MTPQLLLTASSQPSRRPCPKVRRWRSLSSLHSTSSTPAVYFATAELAEAARIERSTRVLDAGCGIGGPARYLAVTFGCNVTGVDLRPAFIDAAAYLTLRCGIQDRLTFQVANALRLPFEDAAFDAVLLLHVAMNIDDRAVLYAEVRRVLIPGGRFATYDLVLREGNVFYPVPWARDASTSFLLRELDTRAALEEAGFKAVLWRDGTQTALDGSTGPWQAQPRVD